MFENRLDAGNQLSKELLRFKGEQVVVLAIPRGGVPVAFPIATSLGAPLDVISPRKIPIPDNPEAGFGAVTEDGTIVLNDLLVAEIGLTPEQIDIEAEKVRREVERRIKKYRGGRSPPDLQGKTVIIVDDGLASGYTMLAAVESVKTHRPKRIIVAIPVAPVRSINLVEPYVDEVVALIKSRAWAFAVASHYWSFPDLSDEEVLEYLEKARATISTAAA